MEAAANATQALAAGVQALPGLEQALAAAQAAWRVFANQRTALKALVEPLREAGRHAAATNPAPYVLLVHDWSKLDFAAHRSKIDVTQPSPALDYGDERTTALLVDAHHGAPLAPLAPMGVKL